MTERTRALIEKQLDKVQVAISAGCDPVGIVRILTEVIPLCVDRRTAHAYVEASFEAHHSTHPDLEIDVSTAPFSRVGPV
jgi:hypothetical protein